jgi:hypothetical protein
MTTPFIEYCTIDKSAWPAGEWQDEVDKAQWQDEATGLPCLAVRHSNLGHLCGYVGVDAKHPLHGKDYDVPEVDVHGGLTFASACAEGDESRSICHVAGDGDPDHVWWFGFDCGHLYDMSPGRVRSSNYWGDEGDVYRNIDYVKRECAKLAERLQEAA